MFKKLNLWRTRHHHIAMKYEFFSSLAWMLCVSMVSTDEGNKNTSESIPHDQSKEPVSHHHHHRPIRIEYHTLVNYGAVVFAKPGLDTYKALVIDTAEGTPWTEGIYVGARNCIIKFSMSLKKAIVLKLPAEPEQIEKCKRDWPVDDCHNFIKFLEVTKFGNVGTIIACGTYAHSPNCIAVLATSLIDELRRIAGLSPGNPYVDVASYVVNDGVYIGISAESPGRSGKILYTKWKKDARTIRSMESKLWLNDVHFVGAFSPTKEHKFIYFVFRESAIDSQAANSTHSRVGRICREDNGAFGNYKDYFASFTKAYLVCGDYHHVQDISYNENYPYFWATFSGGALNNGSAICRYKIVELESVFGGNYFHPDPNDKRWEESKPRQLHKEDDVAETCYGIRSMKAVMQYTMMSSMLSPHCNRPAFVTNDATFNKIATVLGEDNNLFVVFSGDELGRVWKMDFTDIYYNTECISKAPKGMHIWEVIPPSESSKEINRLSVSNESLIVLTNKAVMKIPVWYYSEEEEELTTTERNNKSSSIMKAGWQLEKNGTKNENTTPATVKTKTRTREDTNYSSPRFKFSCSQTTIFVILTVLLTF